MYKGVICFKVSHTTMGNLQYRSHVSICRQLCKDSVIPQNICLPVPLFTCMMNQQASWGRYVIYMTWLDQQLPSQGCIVFRFLKTHYPVWMYSFPYFVGQYLLYHVAKTINSLGRSLRARIVRRRECVCQSPQDTPTPSETTTGTASELYAALASTSTSSYFTHQVV